MTLNGTFLGDGDGVYSMTSSLDPILPTVQVGEGIYWIEYKKLTNYQRGCVNVNLIQMISFGCLDFEVLDYH